jgi:DnaD/phage-associated family protein
MQLQGWISLHRQIQCHWLWQEKPFSKGQAWIDILLLANHEDNKFPLGEDIVSVKRGSFITSELNLMDRWGWSKAKVRRFLDLLRKDNMIVKKTDRKKTAITIVKYDTWQETETKKEPKKDRSETDDRPKKDTNNNDNNDNNREIREETGNYNFEIQKLQTKCFEFGMSGLPYDLMEDAEMRLKEGTDIELIIKALSIAATKINNPKAIGKYTINILKSWAASGIKTSEQQNRKIVPFKGGAHNGTTRTDDKEYAKINPANFMAPGFY